MGSKVPETLPDFLKAIGERSLRDGFRVMFSVELPDYLCTEGQYFRAGKEWKNGFQEPLEWLGLASQRALAYLPDLSAANTSFINDIESIPGLREFFIHPRQAYLNELMLEGSKDARVLEKILNLFVELAA